jgi:hypothetical protein
MTPLHIAIPAWGEAYIRLALRYTIPSIRAAKPWDGPVTLVIHTDEPGSFFDVGLPVQIRPKPPGNGHAAQAIAHREVVTSAPLGSVLMLLNADVVVSVECFSEAQRLLSGGAKVLAALGLRCLIRDSDPPIGVDAKTLHKWAWKNRHPINEDCVWGRGKTGTPTLLFFERGESVTARCFHMHPAFIAKDRDLSFGGTIDDDLIGRYTSSEVHVICHCEMAFAELSPASKQFRSVGPLSIDRVVQFGAHRFRPAHIEMFEHNSIRILGDGPTDETPAAAIVDAIRQRNQRPPLRHQMRRPGESSVWR